MSSTIYLLRHGPTDSRNLTNDIGQADLPLSNWGIIETNLLRKWYDNGHDYPIYTSPALCCRQSAEIIGGYKEKKSLLSFIKNDVLKPIIVFDELADINIEISQTENFETAGKHLKKALVQITSHEEEPCIVISHADVIQTFLLETFHIPFSQEQQMPYPYLGITKLLFDGSAFRLADSMTIGERPVEMLRQEEIAHFYNILKTPPEHVNHMQTVSQYIDNILAFLSKDLESHNAELIRAASLTYLADPRDPSEHKHSAAFLRKNGYSAVANIIENLDAVKITDILTSTELLYYADNSILNGQLISLEERFSQEECRNSKKYEWLKAIQKKLYYE